MKEELTNYRTQFDQKANYNRKGLYQAQKQVYHTEITISNRCKEQAHRQFKLQPLEIGFLTSLTLKDDPKFISIQKTFQKYNEEVLTMKVNPQDGLHLKKIVMDCMLKFMRVMLLAPDAQSKKVILDISYYWLIKHLNPKSQRKTAQQLNTDIRTIISQHQLVPQSLLDRELPSNKLAADLKEYKLEARTQYKELDAPEHQLQNYQVHKVSYMNQGLQKPETDAERWKRKLLKFQYLKPKLQQYYHEQDPKEDEKIEIPLDPSAIIPQNQKHLNIEGAQIPVQVPVDGQPPVIANAQLDKQMDLLNQMGGEPEDQDQVVIEEDEDKKRGKLDPLVKIYQMKLLQQKQKEGSFEHPPINQRERYRNNYKQALKKEDELFSRHMNDWASKRSRFKTQVSRKVTAIRVNPNQTAVLTRQPLIQDSFSKTRINQAVRDGRKYVRGQLNNEALNTEGGLSCFDRRRVKTQTATTNKHFSHILQDNRRTNQRQECLTEIESIKQKFARYKIYTSMQAMKGGLMQQQERGEDEETDKVEYPVCLMSNPFFVGKKKKKKGKKKKR